MGGALSLKLEEGATELVSLELKAVIMRVGQPGEEPPTAGGPADGGPADGAPADGAPSRFKALFIGGAAAAGVGVGSLVVGTVLMAHAGAKKSSRDRVEDDCVTADGTYCTSSQVREVESLANKEEQARTGAVIAYAAGGVALAAGVAMMVFAGGGGKKERTGRFVQPFVGPRSAGLFGRF